MDFRVGRDGPLLICDFDPETGACPPMEVAPAVGDSTPRLSGRRLVWDAGVGDENSDVFYCEYDPVRGRCPVQRLTAEMTSQTESDIDGRRVVWRAARAGSSTIFGTTLPGFAPAGPTERRVRGGRRLKLRVETLGQETRRRSRSEHPRPAQGPIEVEALRREGDALVPVSLDSLGARFREKSGGRGELRWRPRSRQAGEYVFTFSAHTETGLTFHQSFRVNVEGRGRSNRR